MADLEANFMHLQLMQESLARFSDCFASFLYGLNVNAWCVDFPEVIDASVPAAVEVILIRLFRHLQRSHSDVLKTTQHFLMTMTTTILHTMIVQTLMTT
jgi:hypothetical protein